MNGSSRPTRSAAAAYGRIVGAEHGRRWAADFATQAELVVFAKSARRPTPLLCRLAGGWFWRRPTRRLRRGRPGHGAFPVRIRGEFSTRRGRGTGSRGSEPQCRA